VFVAGVRVVEFGSKADEAAWSLVRVAAGRGRIDDCHCPVVWRRPLSCIYNGCNRHISSRMAAAAAAAAVAASGGTLPVIDTTGVSYSNVVKMQSR